MNISIEIRTTPTAALPDAPRVQPKTIDRRVRTAPGGGAGRSGVHGAGGRLGARQARLPRPAHGVSLHPDGPPVDDRGDPAGEAPGTRRDGAPGASDDAGTIGSRWRDGRGDPARRLGVHAPFPLHDRGGRDSERRSGLARHPLARCHLTELLHPRRRGTGLAASSARGAAVLRAQRPRRRRAPAGRAPSGGRDDGRGTAFART